MTGPATNPFGITQMQQGAAAAHEMFMAYIEAGFTREEALQITLTLIVNAQPHERDPDVR